MKVKVEPSIAQIVLQKSRVFAQNQGIKHQNIAQKKLPLQPMKTLFQLVGILLFASALTACKDGIQGSKNLNKAPDTHLTTDSIVRQGSTRYTTNVYISWWGDDPDGLVNGYEFTFDSAISPSTKWYFTNRTDSIFPMSIPVGSDSLDFVFSVRSIDNAGAKDETPARLWYPIKNSNPVVNLLRRPDAGNPLAGGNPTITMPILKFFWEGSDPDGKDNIAYYEVFLNDTSTAATAYKIDAQFSSLTLAGNSFSGTTTDCKVYPGSSINPLTGMLNVMLLNDTNQFFIRAVDRSGAKSLFASSDRIFVKKPSGRLLLVSTNYTPDAQADAFYRTKLTALGIAYDFLPLFNKVNGKYVYLSADPVTQGKIFKLYDAIVWYGDDIESSLAFGQNTLNEFITKGGDLLFSSFAPGVAPVTSNSYAFSPIETLDQAPTGFTYLMTDTSTLNNKAAGYPTVLQYTEFLPVVRPMTFVSGTTILYGGNVLVRNNNTFQNTPYVGTAGLIGMKQNQATGSKIVLSSLELHKLDGLNNMTSLLNKILKTEFGL